MGNYIAPEKYDATVSPVGEALWAFLTVPDKRWKKEFGEYKVNLLMEPGKKVSTFIASLEAIRDEYFETLKEKMTKLALKKKPLKKRPVYSEAYDAAGDETGKLEFKFQTMAGGKKKEDGTLWEMSPKLYDSGANLIQGVINIGNGSILQVNYKPAAYKITGDEYTSVGCKCYLNAVMIHKLVEFSGGDPGFEAVEGGFTYEDGTNKEGANPDFTPGDGSGDKVDF